MCSPRKTGNTTPHRGGGPRVGWARKRSWTTGWQRPDVRDCAGLHGETGISRTRRRAPGFGKTSRRASAQAQGSVQRSARNQGQPSSAATTRMRVTTATPEATRSARTGARWPSQMPNSVPSGEWPCARSAIRPRNPWWSRRIAGGNGLSGHGPPAVRGLMRVQSGDPTMPAFGGHAVEDSTTVAFPFIDGDGNAG